MDKEQQAFTLDKVITKKKVKIIMVRGVEKEGAVNGT